MWVQVVLALMAPPLPLLLHTLGRAPRQRKAWWALTMFATLAWAVVGAAAVGSSPEEGTVAVDAVADAPTTTVDPVTRAIGDGYVARCKDGDFSNNLDFGKTCSGGDGVDTWLATYGQCRDESVIIMGPEASCDGHGGFRYLLPAGYEPTAATSDLAKCKNGLFSDNSDLAAACSANGGVDSWLAPYGECSDGSFIIMSKDASCDGRGGFRALVPVDQGPTARPDDVAKCANGLFSDNTDFDNTCGDNGGVESWLAPYGECNNGKVISIDEDASCSVHGGFRVLRPDYVPPVTTTTAPPPPTAPSPDATALSGNDGVVSELEWIAAGIVLENQGLGYATTMIGLEDAQEMATAICSAAPAMSSQESLMFALYTSARGSGFSGYEAETVVPALAGALMVAACESEFDRLVGA
ncbi:MAG: hypothetical protein GEV08_02580 [Acidimicrobiia bacterium]|nr:hypothetical protein [Acidimicrobiia bacterium]